MYEYQVIVAYAGQILFKTCWQVGEMKAREIAWLLASRLGDGYEIGVGTRKEEFLATPWREFGLDQLEGLA